MVRLMLVSVFLDDIRKNVMLMSFYKKNTILIEILATQI